MWVMIPGFNGYEINEYGQVRSFKMFRANPGHIMKLDSSGKYTLSNDMNERVRISPQELMQISFTEKNIANNTRGDNMIHIGSRNKVFVDEPKRNKTLRELKEPSITVNLGSIIDKLNNL